MENLIGTPESTLQDVFSDWRIEPYRIHQVFNWVYNYGIRDFQQMTNLSKVLRNRLQERFSLALPHIQKKLFHRMNQSSTCLNWRMNRR
ncbi:MAG: hypothetical protein VX667_06315 [Nitrospinota bacterium]|nr:hypothetical protein [Nitrospinota bacterium]